MRTTLIAAVDNAYGLGKAGTIPWHFPEDLRHFKFVTTSTSEEIPLDDTPVETAPVPNAVVMGRVTWESLPAKHRPLKNRINYVVSSQEYGLADTGAFWFDNLERCMRSAATYGCPNLFIIGGQQLYVSALSKGYVDSCLITHVPGDYQCDRALPELKYYNFRLQNTYNLGTGGLFVSEWVKDY